MIITPHSRIVTPLLAFAAALLVCGQVRPAETNAGTGATAAGEGIEFSRDIRPILSDTCFKCHGPDKSQRKSDLRLDTRDGAFGDLGGYRAIVPGKPDESELVRRIISEDADEKMPPPDSGLALTAPQIERLRSWVRQGAPWQQQWSFVAPVRPELPAVELREWCRNPIDCFVLARLEREGLSPSPEADKPTLIRRVALDLTGLPPSPEELRAFMTDVRPDAYERLVDRLLDSPRYGEHLATQWLDAARYADTSGYQTDGVRHMWRWRDWVIDALNRNQPFDQFTIEQLAGDLLPNPTLDQLIATGFNRNHRANSEGGIVFEEYLVEYAVDRVDTTATVWLGLTLGCARCHEHKYDPISQKEYYQVLAYFNNVPERGRVIKYGNSAPLIKAPTPLEQEALATLDDQIRQAEVEVSGLRAELESSQADWEKTPPAPDSADWTVTAALKAHFPLDGNAADATNQCKTSSFPNGEPQYANEGRISSAAILDGNRFVQIDDVPKFSGDTQFSFSAWVYFEEPDAGTVLSLMDDGDSRDKGFSLDIEQGKIKLSVGPRWLDDAIRMETQSSLEPRRWYHVLLTYDGSQMANGARIYVDGQLQNSAVLLDQFTGTFTTEYPLRIGSRGADSHFRGRIDDVRYYHQELSPAEVFVVSCADTIRQIVATPPEKRSESQEQKIADYFLRNQAPAHIRLAHERLEKLYARRRRLETSVTSTMVMQDRPEPRQTFVLFRGEYDKPREPVQRGVPAALPPLPPGAPANRLGLAQWLVDPANPLTARVAVNRYWNMYFGGGLVKTLEDFGTQGEQPSHPQLLDWLAAEFVSSGWDVKAMQELIVTSATYRQASRVSPQLLEQDPDNRLLARAPRLRLSAETIRDQALAAAGLLDNTIGGPSAKPYQPDGLWSEIASDSYQQDRGRMLYRRGMYTFRKRTVPPPEMTTFDATARETCTVMRSRTNTPLQALTLLNDPTFVEAARALSQRTMTGEDKTPEQWITRGFQLVISRPPTARELEILLAAYHRQLSRFERHQQEAIELLSVGESPRNQELNAAQFAAMTTVASLILNLDEAVTRE